MDEHVHDEGPAAAGGARDSTTVSLSPTAVDRVKLLMAREGRPASAGLRVSVVGGGCSGLSYQFKYDAKPRERDHVFEYGDVRVFVDPDSSGYLAGTVVDYVDGLHGAGFKFVNPNADRTCGCGSSFSV